MIPMVSSSLQISIIVPAYNAEKTLEACIESIRGQSFSAWELIVVNDGSSDETKRICERYAASDSRIRAVHQPNQGPSAARNHGLSLALGPFVCFADSDDTLESSMLEDLYGAMVTHGVDLVISGLTLDYPKEGVLRPFPLREGRVALPAEIDERYEEWTACRALHSHCGKLYKTDILRRYGIQMDPSLSILEDGLFVLDYLSHSASIYCLPSTPYHYRQTREPSLVKAYHPCALKAWTRYAQAGGVLHPHLSLAHQAMHHAHLWRRWRQYVRDVYACSSLPARQKRDLLREFLTALHEWGVSEKIPSRPEKGFFKGLCFALAKKRRVFLLHLLLLARYTLTR